MEVDASNDAVGAILSQEQDDKKLHPIGYYSKTLNSAEQNYAITEKELLGLILALEHWRHHLARYHVQGEPGVIILTDHLPLVNLATLPASPRRARWSERLTPYHYVIKWKKGTSNKKADALSRKDKTNEKEQKLDIIPEFRIERPDVTESQAIKVNHEGKITIDILVEDDIIEKLYQAQQRHKGQIDQIEETGGDRGTKDPKNNKIQLER